MNLAIIGGGASALAAAITAGRRNIDITVFERGSYLGKKLAATGNGRCNLCNEIIELGFYRGNKDFIKAVFSKVGKDQILDFFASIGVLTRTESGRIYPYSNRASSVTDALLSECKRLNIDTVYNFDVASVEKKDGYFYVNKEYNTHPLLKTSFQLSLKALSSPEESNRLVSTVFNEDRYKFDKCLIAAGGACGVSNGGGGYGILQSFGHSVTKLYPSLVQLICDRPLNMKSIRLFADASLIIDGETVKREHGEVQFTDYGLSGVVIFNLSPTVASAVDNDRKVTVSLDLLPHINDCMPLFIPRRREYEAFFTGMFQRPVASLVYKKAGIKKKPALDNNDIIKIAKTVKDMRFDIRDTMGFDSAQVTSGGAKLDEFSPHTMQSLRTDGLYAAGEVLDADGDCGGYNLAWAWATGILAGKNI